MREKITFGWETRIEELAEISPLRTGKRLQFCGSYEAQGERDDDEWRDAT
jgi:hypothetical protein